MCVIGCLMVWYVRLCVCHTEWYSACADDVDPHTLLPEEPGGVQDAREGTD